MSKFISLSLSIILTFMFLQPNAIALKPSSPANFYGVDIYHGTSQVNWASLAASKNFVYIKATEGEHTSDSAFTRNVYGAQSTGMKWGAYHFLHIYGQQSAQIQARFFYNTIRKYSYSCIPVVDVEITDGQEASEIQADLRAFIQEFKNLSGTKPMIYTNVYYANRFIGGGFTDCRLWIANYGVSEPGNVAGWTSWDAWQYTNTGNISAIANEIVDLDVATTNIFLSSTLNAQPTGNTTSDVFPVSWLPYAINATAAADFYLRNADGTIVFGRMISTGDPMIILSVDYDSQLAEILYPSYAAGQWIHGYIRNLQNLIHNTGYNKWQNGSTNEPVYNASGVKIGTIYPYEKATVLYRNGRLMVLYGTNKGPETKSGYVDYNDGVTGY